MIFDIFKDAFDLFEVIRNRWEKKSTIIFLEIIGFLLYIKLIIQNCCDISRSGKEIFKNLNYLINVSSVFGFVCLCVFILWLLSNRIPRVGKNKIGIIYAFEAENSLQDKRLKNDFYNQVTTITQTINNSEIETIFLSAYKARLIIQDENYAIKVIQKSKANIMLYGKIEQRKSNNSDIYNITFDAIVRHNSVPRYISDAICSEMRTVLPTSVNFDIKNEFNCFRYTSDKIALALNFIIGMAYYYSKRFLVSYSIHSSCYNLTKQELMHNNSDQILLRTESRLKIYITREAIALAEIELKKGNYSASQHYVDLALGLDQHNYDALLEKSIISFMLGKIDESLQVLNICQTNKNDYTWLYNKAFIYTFKEQFDRALRIYHVLKDKPAGVNVANQCEFFIIDYVEKNPSTYKLYYALGMIYYKIKNDYVLAEYAFSMFVKLSKQNNKYSSTVEKVERILVICQKNINNCCIHNL